MHQRERSTLVRHPPSTLPQPHHSAVDMQADEVSVAGILGESEGPDPNHSLHAGEEHQERDGLDARRGSSGEGVSWERGWAQEPRACPLGPYSWV